MTLLLTLPQVVDTLEVTAWRADRVTETRVQTQEAQDTILPSQVQIIINLFQSLSLSLSLG